jgi:hypothetical protein
MLTLAVTAAPALAQTVQFEGIAPAGGSLAVGPNDSRLVDGFNVFVPFGRYIDSAFPQNGTFYPSNGTDYLAIDDQGGVTISRPGNATFSLTRFDAGEFSASGGSPAAPGVPIDVLGSLQGGGTIATTFAQPAGAPTFRTFTLPAGWNNLVSVNIREANFFLVVDNVVAPVPEPTVLSLLAVVASLGAPLRTRSRASARDANSAPRHSSI